LIYDLVSGEMFDGDVAICGDMIVGVGDVYDGREVIDLQGLTLVPGFIDTHLHVESSLVTPFEFDRCVTPLGVTTAICDPHEIANVIGAPGIRYFQEASEHTLMDLRVQLSSCVPSTDMETSGAVMGAEEIAGLMGHPSGIGLAEFMNYPGVIHRDPEAMAKLRCSRAAISTGIARFCRAPTSTPISPPGFRPSMRRPPRRRRGRS
jgi:adenine deaminase